MTSFNEEYMLVVGKKLGRFYIGKGVKHTIGNPGEVGFDLDYVLDREQEKGDIIGFYHTHPPFYHNRPSSTDVNTMKGMILAFGRPLMCAIDNVRYGYANHWFYDDEKKHVTLTGFKFGNWFIGVGL